MFGSVSVAGNYVVKYDFRGGRVHAGLEVQCVSDGVDR